MKKSIAMRVMLAQKLLLVVAVFSMLISCEQSTESARSPELDKLFRSQGRAKQGYECA